MTVPADLDRRFRDAAARTGLLDAAYDGGATALGTGAGVEVATWTRDGVRISWRRRSGSWSPPEELFEVASKLYRMSR